jgi:hypothetical protein
MKDKNILKYYAFRSLIKRISTPILVIYMLDIGLSLGQIATVAAVGSIMSIIFEVPSGMLADTFGHKATLIISCIGKVAVVLSYLGGTFAWILAARIGYSFFGALFSGTADALFFEYLQEEGRADEHKKLAGKAKGIAYQFGIISMLVAGAAYTFAFWLPFALEVVQFILAAVVIYSFAAPKKAVNVSEKEGFWYFLSHFGVSSRQILKNRMLAWLVIVSALIQGVILATIEFRQVLYTDVGLIALYIGGIYALNRFVAGIAAPFTHVLTDKFSVSQAITGLGWILILHLVIVSVTKSPLVIIFGMLLGAAARIVLNVATNDYANHLSTNGSRATLLSMNSLIQSLVAALMAGVFGYVMHVLGVSEGYMISASILLIIVVLSIYSIPKKIALAKN